MVACQPHQVKRGERKSEGRQCEHRLQEESSVQEDKGQEGEETRGSTANNIKEVMFSPVPFFAYTKTTELISTKPGGRMQCMSGNSLHLGADPDLELFNIARYGIFQHTVS